MVALTFVFATAACSTSPNPFYASRSGGAGGAGGKGGVQGSGRGGAPTPGDVVDAGEIDAVGLAPGSGGTGGQGDPAAAPSAGGGARGDDAGLADSATLPDAAPSLPVNFKGDLAKSLSLYLPLDDGPGNSVAHDASGKGAIAMLKNIDPNAGWPDRMAGRALALEGSSWSGWLDLSGDGLTKALSQQFSMSLWIYRKDAGGTLLSRRSFGTRGFHFQFALETDTLALQLNPTNGYNVHLRANGTVPTGKWVHVAATYDLNIVTLYLDGAVVGAAPYMLGLPLDTSPIIVGGLEQQDMTVNTRFTGEIDDVAFYGRALTLEEVKALATGSHPPAH